MSYYEDVYLKRMNVDGNNIVDRVKTRKEIEFDKLFLQKTKYQAMIYQVNDESMDIKLSLQPHKWNEDEIISNFLLSTKSRKLKTGDLVFTWQKVKNQEQQKIWIIVYVDDDMTHGYQKYQAICLDSTINYTSEYGDTLEAIPVKFVNASSSFVSDSFQSSSTQPLYREPADNRRFICKDYDFLKKALYFNFKSRGWEISGIDRLSIDGVAYVSISEALTREPEPKNSEEILVGRDNNFFLNNR